MLKITDIVEKIKNPKTILIFLVFVEHLLFFYFNNVINKDNLLDATEFYNRSLEIDIIRDFSYLMRMGSRFMLLITSMFSSFIHDFVTISLIFSLISFMPYYFIIDKYFDDVKKGNLFLKFTFLFLLFIPSMHIWTTSILKETLILPLMYFLLQSIHRNWKINIRRFDVLIYFFLLFCIRPYLASIFLLAYVVSNYRFLNKKVMLMIAAGCIIFVILFFKLMLPHVGISDIGNELAKLNDYSKAAGSSFIDLDTVYIQRLIYMMFRPLFFDADTKSQLIYSFENLILAVWFLLLLYTIFKTKIKAVSLFQNIFIVTAVLVWLFVGIYIYNYGLASRMKVMIIPFILIGIIEIIKQKQCSGKINQN